MEVASSLGLTWGEKEIHAPSLTVCSNFRGSSFLSEKKIRELHFSVVHYLPLYGEYMVVVKVWDLLFEETCSFPLLLAKILVLRNSESPKDCRWVLSPDV